MVRTDLLLDGTSINTYGYNSVYKNIQDSNILYPTIYQNNIDENRSYSGFYFRVAWLL